MPGKKIALIIGAGPAGLTVAYELLQRTEIKPIIIELTDGVGGICKTVNYKGNRIDIGGHRFFSKSDRVMNWWLNILPLEKLNDAHATIAYHNKSREISATIFAPDPEKEDKVMLLRKRSSRIYFLRKFFDYPITLSPKTLAQLGLVRVLKIGAGYLKSILFPIKPEKNLEDFFINRFGKELYLTFFRSYTEKVWGRSCTDISAEWGHQRIKGLSVSRSIGHFLKSILSSESDIRQKETETSLIQQFLYPKYGPGQLWDEAAAQVKSRGGELLLNHTITKISTSGNRVASVVIKDLLTNITTELKTDHLFSTMPVKELVKMVNPAASPEISRAAEGLHYRDFITVGLLVKKLNTANPSLKDKLADNWIYIQEPDVKLGRLQVFNNWSPYMVADRNSYWLGLEYFCNEGDPLWQMDDKEMYAFAIEELCKIGIIKKEDVQDGTVIRMPKAYPAYFGTYPDFDVIRKFTDGFENLFLIGRNGMHKYNNQDHSMLTAMVAVDNIVGDITSKENIWAVNTEEDYHEEK
ncbi:MAG: NAD(P)/FAD-dependent oxidoreductase [Bacteroidetes bacterium]|nr:NAD(P)/FAD-dependent oxidoreductase [Bacteroidota bacterium]